MIELSAEGGDNEIELTWNLNADGRSRDVVNLEFGNVDLSAGTAEVVMTNSEAVGGFQFTISGATVSAASGGSATSAGFMVSASGTTVLGFSLTGATIPAGTGVLTLLDLNDVGDELCLASSTISDAGGGALSTTLGGCYPEEDDNPTPDADVVLSFANIDYVSGTLDVLMTNVVAVGGFQFSVSGITVNEGSGGSAANAGFMVSAGGTTVLGFSLTGATIPAGSGILTTLSFSSTGDDVCFVSATISDAGGNPVDNALGGCNGEGGGFDDGGSDVEGCTDMTACNYNADATADDGSCEYESCAGCWDMSANNYCQECSIECSDCCEYDVVEYNVWRDGVVIATVSSTNYTDTGLESGTEYCYIVQMVINEGTDLSNEACASTNEQSLQFFTDLPEDTGVTSLVVIEQALDLEPGDEIGLFDSNGMLNYNDCNTEYGELLVGAGVWTGSQLNLTGTGSVDFCSFGGVQLAGYVEGNPIHFKVWKASENAVYDAEATYSAGTGSWGDILTSVSLLEPVFSITQDINLNALQVNLFSTNVIAEDMTTSTFFNGINLLIASDDGGNYYVPSFDVDSIEEMSYSEGYSAFLQGMDDATISIEGLPCDPATSLQLDALQVNLMPFLPSDCMATSDVFDGLEDRVLIVKDDGGNYYVPAYNVESLDIMCPGDGYEIFLQGMEDLEFQFPSSDGLARVETTESTFWSNYKTASVSTEYEFVKTGISHPVILTDLMVLWN